MMALLDEAESFFISHIRQGLRILLFLFGNSYSCTVPVLTTDVTDILTDMPGRSVATPGPSHACHGSTQQYDCTLHGAVAGLLSPSPSGEAPSSWQPHSQEVWDGAVGDAAAVDVRWPDDGRR
jgi:hypothetical protein